ncbi:hypothetical protein ACVWVZ_000062 [Pseudomonas tolaasii]
MNAMAVQYGRELSLWGVETSIIVPGAFTKGANHFAHSSVPADAVRAAAYKTGSYAGFGEQVQKALAEIVSDDADVAVVGAPLGKRPFRAHIDPTRDSADVGVTALDQLRAKMLHRVGLSDLLKSKVLT